MKNKVKNQAITVCCTLLALGFVAGVTSLRTEVEASANETVATVEMLAGARVKLNQETPSLKFEGVVNGYDADATVEYGMLIMTEETYVDNVFEDNYHTVLDAEDVYTDSVCVPYTVEDTTYIAAYAEVTAEDYATNYIAIGYSVENGVYNYAEVNLMENARSVMYVAQMSLLYDTLTEENQALLESYVDATYTQGADYDAAENNFDKEELGVYGGSVNTTNYVVEIDYSQTREGYHTFQTADLYQNITEITFDAYVPNDSANRWWGIAFTVNTEKDCYADATVTANLQNYVIMDTWVTYKYTTTDGVNWTVQYGVKGGELSTAYTAASATNTFTTPAYIFMTSAPTSIGGNGTFLKLDNFSWVADGKTYQDDFNTGDSVLFTERADEGCDPVVYKQVSQASISFGATQADGEDDYAAVLDFSVYEDGHKGFTTKTAYSNITEVKLDVYIPTTNAATHWWGITPVARNSGDSYEGSDAAAGSQNLKNILVDNYGWVGRWVTLTYTVVGTTWTLSIGRAELEESYEAYTFNFSGGTYQSNGASYLFVCARPGASNWGVQLDNVSITADGKTYTDDFNTGASTLFEEHVSGVLSYEALYLAPIPSFEKEIADNTLMETLKEVENIISVELSWWDEWKELAPNALRLETSLTYAIQGDKGVLIAFGYDEGNDYSYLYLTEDKIAFYAGYVCQTEIELESAENTLYISVLANGNLLLKINDGEYVGMGVVQNVVGIAIADIEGTGSISFTKISANGYNL